MLEIISIPVLTDNYIYVIHDEESSETAVVDPAIAEPVLTLLDKNGWRLTYILNTHHHYDHVGANLVLKEATSCLVIASEADKDRVPGIDLPVQESDCVYIGQYKAEVIATPGHTSGHIVYYFTDDQLLFCGDTLFGMGCGRLFEGTAELMWQSLQKLKILPPTTKVYCAHEYTQSNGRFALSIEPDNFLLHERMANVNQVRTNLQPTVPSSIALELATNPFLREQSLSLQKTINRVGFGPVAIFAEVRRLKDKF